MKRLQQRFARACSWGAKQLLVSQQRLAILADRFHHFERWWLSDVAALLEKRALRFVEPSPSWATEIWYAGAQDSRVHGPVQNVKD
jgi:hypothetical protein